MTGSIPVHECPKCKTTDAPTYPKFSAYRFSLIDCSYNVSANFGTHGASASGWSVVMPSGELGLSL